MLTVADMEKGEGGQKCPKSADVLYRRSLFEFYPICCALVLLFCANLKRKFRKHCLSHPAKIDLNKNLDPKQKTIQAFHIDV